MTTKHLLYFILFPVLLFSLKGCALFKGNKKPVELDLRYNSGDLINYGYSFGLKTFLIYNNGKEKDVTDKDELKVNISGATYSEGIISINNYPKSLSENIIYVDATYTKDEVVLSKKVEIPFNYKGDVELSFTGKNGNKGIRGKNGGTSLLFRYGNDGEIGGPGGPGGDGDNLTVYIWKDSSGYYFVKVNNLVSGQAYYYKIKNERYFLKLNVSGGSGGYGGDGGDGGEGKDASSSGTKNKSPGRGGNGATAGNGGPGGKGGNIYVFIHPNAAEIQGRILLYNYGGNGGNGGQGGSGGKGGTPLEGQTAGISGLAGSNGMPGYIGKSGDVLQILVEEFDIE